MTGTRKIVKERRDYNTWVATETLEDYSLRYAPQSFRKWPELLVANTALGGISFLALEAIGGSLLISYGFANSFWAIITVSLIIFLVGIPITYYAAKYNIDMDLLTRGAGFGYIGSTITSLVYASFTFIFFALEAAIMAQALNLYFHFPLAWGYLFCSIIIIPIVFYGITLINKIQLWTQPIWLFLMIAPYIFVLYKEPDALSHWTHFSGYSTSGAAFDPLLFGAAATVSFSLIAQLGEQVDYLRFLPNPEKNNKKRWWLAVIVAGPGWIILGCAKQLGGAFLASLAIQHGATISQAKEPIQMYLAGFSDMFGDPKVVLLIGTIFVIISQIKINVTNAYAGSLAWSNFFSRLTHSHPGRVVWLVFNVTIALLLMELGVFETLEAVLGLYSNVAIAWVGALVADLVINKPLGISPSYIEFKRAYLYNINPVGFGSMAIASAISILAFLGLLGDYAQAYSAFLALGIALILSPAIAFLTGGKYYIARENTLRHTTQNLLTCCICEQDYEPADTAFCPVYDGPICSLCCTLDAHCHDRCKTDTQIEQKPLLVRLSAKIFRDKLSPQLGIRILRFTGIFVLLAGSIGVIFAIVYHQGITRSPQLAALPHEDLLTLFWQLYTPLFLLCGLGAWWLVLSEESRELAEDELDKQNQQLQAEIHERQRAEAALQALTHELENRVEQRTAELQDTVATLKKTQMQLIQNEKLSSLGQLVAGVAHEINNPVNFIHGNLEHATNYVKELLSAIAKYRQEFPYPSTELSDFLEDIELDFIEEDLPKLLASMNLGTERIRQIVLSLRVFSRVDESEVKPINIHDGIESTLMILGNRLKANADHPTISVIRNYSELPLIECYAGQLNQVFMNLLANAIDAFEDHNRDRTYADIQADPNIITITTNRLDADWISIEFADNGPGIPEQTQAKIFDAFFTTKNVGKGTGLGLSICYQIVTEKHQGKLTCLSQIGQGTIFRIEIPIRATVHQVTQNPQPKTVAIES